ncbi:alpha-amylase family glycosyl hydrolase [Pseudoalteromonas sp. T1lg24]|uniref:alpha-amylase family glycosyl hydrolase n=1 Tax=Pseudoalteromonas sp. T1lg24 TaxID=2077099 RepID=UPI000CF71903
MKKKMYALFALLMVSHNGSAQSKLVEEKNAEQKPVVYQVFTRLFGNTNNTNKPWGSKAENGVGKFADFTPKALNEIKDMGVSHIWYTGVLHHAMAEDYTQFGISLDDPDVIKGRAGSPYAIKDYYSVNPDLANNPAKRIEEFEALIKRSHAAGLKVIIDIVPNHVARRYESIAKPKGVIGLGENDDTSVTYSKFNDFYYIPGAAFSLPKFPEDYSPLGGEAHPLVDGKFDENPAKWTGNGSREAQPDFNDWYETVKVNYGVKPDGSFDFAKLPSEYAAKNYHDVVTFWQDKELPSSWHKMRDIAFYWLDKGVDGFRYDMAEMVPVEFWSYLNAHIKTKNPEATLIAEVYNPKLYRDYIQLGKMDYLYDKVGFYDTLKWIMQGKQSATTLIPVHNEVKDIAPHMLNFLENHDEQRIASPDFVGDMNKGKPAMVVSHLISTSPTLIYFGQEVGEPGAENAGFGSATRTSIFDYVGVPEHQKWMNHGNFDGALLSKTQKELRSFYVSLLNLAKQDAIKWGEFTDVTQQLGAVNDKVIGFKRHTNNQTLLVLANFADKPQILSLPYQVKHQNLLKFAGDNQIKTNNKNTQFTLAPQGAVVVAVE